MPAAAEEQGDHPSRWVDRSVDGDRKLFGDANIVHQNVQDARRLPPEPLTNVVVLSHLDEGAELSNLPTKLVLEDLDLSEEPLDLLVALGEELAKSVVHAATLLQVLHGVQEVEKQREIPRVRAST